MNNVQCAGGGHPPQKMTWSPIVKRYVLLAEGDPCGWKGERLAKAPRWRYWGPLNEHCEDHPEFVAKVTAKPCPHCGGRVELIPEVGS